MKNLSREEVVLSFNLLENQLPKKIYLEKHYVFNIEKKTFKNNSIKTLIII